MKLSKLYIRDLIHKIVNSFFIPIIVAVGIILALFFQFVLKMQETATIVLLLIIFVGSLELIQDTWNSIRNKKFALDYIAILAISVGLASGQYLVSAIIVLMLSGGNTLEKYGMARARSSLTKLTDRIPSSVFLWKKGKIGKKVSIASVGIGTNIVVRRGEVIPLDGTLISDSALVDESSLTGEVYIMEKMKGDRMRSGTVNGGDVLIISVTKIDKDSTYRKIIEMVEAAQREKTPLIRLADKYSVIFTIITLILSGIAYFVSHDLSRVLSVLVIATPCPLILATPIALMGGMNRAGKKRIIMKNLASLEVLSRVDTIIFDKTGTITLGKPSITKLTIIDTTFTEKEVCEIAASIERNSLHPFAKAIVLYAQEKKYSQKSSKNVIEKIGQGISGIVEGKNYTLSKIGNTTGMKIQLLSAGHQIAIFEFEDTIKKTSATIIKNLKNSGLEVLIYTGDKHEVAMELIKQLGQKIQIKSECTPEDKKNGINELKKQRKIIAMVGDGINDAPALALADVGLVFSNEEHTAASEAADIVFLGGDFALVTEVIEIGRDTIHIATQSIVFGIGLSIIGMIFATVGFIPALIGAFLQETIDIAVIFKALRASRE